ncbi:MAG: anthranilate phosphoribosyltransferase, partial [Dehalococcoidales bacterium]|nr:anthranilate phosphoribosyltransferase [Dehalococcoidales bacterium]
DVSLLEKMAIVLQGLGCRHALVVYGEDGLDEITVTGKTYIYELKDDDINNYSISPDDLGLTKSSRDSLAGGTLDENAALLRGVLMGTSGSRQDAVLMNAAAAILAGDRVNTLQEGAALAREAIDNGRALAKLEQLIELSNSLD